MPRDTPGFGQMGHICASHGVFELGYGLFIMVLGQNGSGQKGIGQNVTDNVVQIQMVRIKSLINQIPLLLTI